VVAGGLDVFGEQQRDRVTAEGSAAAGRKQRLVRLVAAFLQPREVVRIVVELRDGDPLNELSQTAETATSGAGVEGVV